MYPVRVLAAGHVRTGLRGQAGRRAGTVGGRLPIGQGAAGEDRGDPAGGEVTAPSSQVTAVVMLYTRPTPRKLPRLRHISSAA